MNARLLPLALLLLAPPLLGAAAPETEAGRWRREAAAVTITRDDWGIAHVHGRSDADAIFGAMVAQAEDDFPRVERNLLTALGRTAEADGEAAVWADLRQRLWIDPAELRRLHAAAPAWLQADTQAWADGLNFFLATHPTVKPQVLTRFEPWMALSFTEGSIGGDIERVDLQRLAASYGAEASKQALAEDKARRGEPKGSNGIAVAPQLTRDGHAMLLINPHTSFFFRSELGMESDAGLHAYGAATWGQFFLYQGWNEKVGWMHTSSGVDAVDSFEETVVERRGGGPAYVVGGKTLEFMARPVVLRIRRPDGTLATRRFDTLHTVHGPVVYRDGGKWTSLALMNRPLEALQQSWLRTKAQDFAGYLKVAQLQANSSNDTILASREGTIAYLHPQFVPQRNDRLDWRDPQDGSDPATRWGPLTPLARLPQVVNPAGGWLYNSNDAPWRAAGTDSPRAADFPRYMDQAGANPRGDHATALLAKAKRLTPQGLMAVAFDPWMPSFEWLVPRLLAEQAATPDPAIAAPIALLRGWDRRWSADSQATSVAMFWGDELWRRAITPKPGSRETPWERMRSMPPGAFLDAFRVAAARMRREWGAQVPAWGEVNRFQRNDGAIRQRFDDAKGSTPVPFTSAKWGSLASFGSQSYPGTRRWYGTNGNSFVAVVEFGPRVRAWAVSAGGESGDPASPHFRDQADRYAAGRLRPVYFWADELKGHVARVYHPGE